MLQDSTADLYIWLNRSGKNMVGEWVIAWVNDTREEYKREKRREAREAGYRWVDIEGGEQLDSDSSMGGGGSGDDASCDDVDDLLLLRAHDEQAVVGDEEKHRERHSSSLTSRSVRSTDVTATAASTSAPTNDSAAVSSKHDIEPTLDSNSDVTSSDDDDDETQVKRRHESTPSPPPPLPPRQTRPHRSRDAGKVIRVDVEPLLRMHATSLSVDTTSPGAYFSTQHCRFLMQGLTSHLFLINFYM